MNIPAAVVLEGTCEIDAQKVDLNKSSFRAQVLNHLFGKHKLLTVIPQVPFRMTGKYKS